MGHRSFVLQIYLNSLSISYLQTLTIIINYWVDAQCLFKNIY